MLDNLPNEKLDDFLLSLNLIKDANIKKSKKILYWLSNNIYLNYRDFKIHKKNGGSRTISEPSKILKNIQKRILKNELEQRKVSKYATAYIKNKSLVQNAYPHINKKVVLKLDIKDFFKNITFMKVYNSCFKSELYPKKIGMLLTNLCMYNESLPQGAPTSGYISNIVMRSFDEKVGKWCINKNISYTRYSDDLTFSGDFDCRKVIYFVGNLLKKEGFLLNKKKTIIVSKKNRQQVTGIIVNEKINVLRTYKNKIRQEIYYIKKYGVKSHLNKIKQDNIYSYLINLFGRINFVNSILKDNNEFVLYKKYVYNLLNKYKNTKN